MRRKISRILAAMLALAMVFALAACSSGKKETEKIVIYDGEFAEMQIIHYMVKLLVEEHTELEVEIRDQMSPVNSYNEMLKGTSDLMNCYDGTLLTTFLHLDPSDVPEGQSLYDFVNEKAADKGVELLDKLGINNTYILATPKATAEKYGIETCSDLAGVSGELIFGAEHDFFTEEGSAKYNPLAEFYGFNFKEAKQIAIDFKYSAIDSGNIDVTVAYATDARNKQSDMLLVKDDLSFFPEYNGALLVRSDLFERFADAAPNLKEVLNMLGGIFTDEDMVNLSYEVDINGRSIAEVSEEYLKGLGLIG